MRDYDLYIYATADPGTGIPPEHLRYRFTQCVRGSTETAVRRDVWSHSLDDAFTDYDTWFGAGEPAGYMWGVKWAGLYPGLSLLPESNETREWSALLGRQVRTILIETNGHNITLVFADLVVERTNPWQRPLHRPVVRSKQQVPAVLTPDHAASRAPPDYGASGFRRCGA